MIEELEDKKSILEIVKLIKNHLLGENILNAGYFIGRLIFKLEYDIEALEEITRNNESQKNNDDGCEEADN